MWGITQLVFSYFSTHFFFLNKTEDLAFGYRILQFSILTGALSDLPMDLYEPNDSHSLKGHTKVYGLEVDCKE